MFKTYFDINQLTLLLISVCFIAISIIFQLRNKYKYALAFLFIGAIVIYLFSALLDPFLNIWDERFHALVAKNLMNHPLRPTLYENPIVNMKYDRWDRSVVWLHKQPLFLWQIALSFKLFGISEFSLRLPSAILSGFLIIFAYRTGKLLINERVGFYAALLFATSFNMIELVSGRVVADHNDAAFLFYTSAGIWAWTEYVYSKRKYWVYLIGVFSGFAVLCKWLTGLLIYFGWLVYLFYSEKFEKEKYRDIFVSFIITLIVVLPWQILVFYKYPIKAMHELNYNSLHFTKVLEGLPERDMWYYIDNIANLYGKLVPYIILLGFVLLYRKLPNKKIKMAFISMPLFVYVFFTLAKTKMPNYTFVVTLPVYLSLACLIDYIIVQINNIKLPKVFISLITFLFLALICFENLNVEKIQEKHTLWKKGNKYTRMLLHNKKIFQSLKLPSNAVLFNVKGRHYIEAMFYTGIPAYNFIPTFDQYKDMKNKGKVIEIFNSKNMVIPDYLKDDSTVIIIQKQLQGYQ